MNAKKDSPVTKAGYSIPEFGTATGLGRSSIYKYMGDGRITFVKAGRRTIITDQPGDFLARLSEKAAA